MFYFNGFDILDDRSFHEGVLASGRDQISHKKLRGHQCYRERLLWELVQRVHDGFSLHTWNSGLSSSFSGDDNEKILVYEIQWKSRRPFKGRCSYMARYVSVLHVG